MLDKDEIEKQIKPGIKQSGNVCVVCGKKLPNVTAAIASHMRKHTKDGSMEEKNDNNKIVWITTGNSPKTTQNKIVNSFSFINRTNIAMPSRIPSTAKSNKNGDISIKCKKCKKYTKIDSKKEIVINSKKEIIQPKFADPRFLVIRCCETITLFPTRLVPQLTISPDREFAN